MIIQKWSEVDTETKVKKIITAKEEVHLSESLTRKVESGDRVFLNLIRISTTRHLRLLSKYIKPWHSVPIWSYLPLLHIRFVSDKYEYLRISDGLKFLSTYQIESEWVKDLIQKRGKRIMNKPPIIEMHDYSSVVNVAYNNNGRLHYSKQDIPFKLPVWGDDVDWVDASKVITKLVELWPERLTYLTEFVGKLNPYIISHFYMKFF